MIGRQLACGLRFWASDLRRGAPVARHLRDVRRSFADPASGRARAASRLDHLLRHACETTVYYRTWTGQTDLARFPVVQKREIQAAPGHFLSAAWPRDSLLTVSTSGSYGAPMQFHWTPETYMRRRAELLYFGSWFGFRVGASFAQVTVYPGGSTRLPALNGFLCDPSVIDEAWLESTRHLLRRERVAFIVGYPTSITPLAAHCLERGDGPADFRLRGVVASSESLVPEARATIARAFGCAVIDRYGTNELGILAQECPEAGRHHVNTAGHVVELLACDRDEPVPAGEVGRVVVTDLFSVAMPLIRYDTGDLAVASDGPCRCGRPGPLLARIEGRQVEQVRDPSGSIVNPLAIGRCPATIQGIVQYQFVQRDRAAYLVRLQVQSPFRGEHELRERFRRLLGPLAEVEVEYVREIRPLPSGKRPYILNEWRRRPDTS